MRKRRESKIISKLKIEDCVTALLNGEELKFQCVDGPVLINVSVVEARYPLKKGERHEWYVKGYGGIFFSGPKPKDMCCLFLDTSPDAEPGKMIIF